MNDLRTAAEQALELCDRINDERTVWGQHELRAVCEALRAALAEDALDRMSEDERRLGIQLSTHSTEPLTDEEIDRVTDAQWAVNNHKPIYVAHRAFARAIERAHGIGGKNGK